MHNNDICVLYGISGQETIIMMTKDFEPITEVAINQDDFGEGIANKSFHLTLSFIKIGLSFKC